MRRSTLIFALALLVASAAALPVFDEETAADPWALDDDESFVSDSNTAPTFQDDESEDLAENEDDSEDVNEDDSSDETEDVEVDGRACPTDKRWGGAGLYCNGNDLVRCSAAGAVADFVSSCDDGCVDAPPGIADYCKSLPPPSMGVNVITASSTPFNPNAAFMQCIGVKAVWAQSYADGLREALQRFNLYNIEEIKIFLANCNVESDHFKATLEYGEKFCHRYSGGCRYKGRGILQLTHDYSYKDAGKFFNMDFLNRPELVEQQPWAFLTATWFWMKYKNVPRCFSQGLSNVCAQKCAAARINGYYTDANGSCGLRDPNHWKERQDEYKVVERCIASNPSVTTGGPVPPPAPTAAPTAAPTRPATPAPTPVYGVLRGNKPGDLCGPGGVGGTSRCANSCGPKGHWSGYCGAGAAICCKP